MANWHYVRNGEKVGPIDDDEFQSLVSAGTITSETLVWRSGMAEWQRYEEIRTQSKSSENVAFGPAPGASYACTECGNTFPSDEIVRYGESLVCAKCKPIFFQRLKEGAPIPTAISYGGFWIRFGAKFIDWFILGVINTALQFALTLGGLNMRAYNGAHPGSAFFGLWVLMVLAQITVAVSYTTFFVGKYGATPGKMACGLKIVRSDRGRVSYLRAFARYFAEMLSGMILAIGYIMAAFDEEKRALHDRICDTRVIRK